MPAEGRQMWFDPTPASWVRDLTDPRDYTPMHDRVRAALVGLRGPRPGHGHRLPPAVDWTEFFPPVPDLHGLAAGTAVAIAGLVAYHERRAFGRTSDLSWAVLFKTSRILARQIGNYSISFRVALKALARFGLPPADLAPADPARFEDDPSGFLYSFAREFEPLLYLRLDPLGQGPETTLGLVKGFVAAGFPVGLGITTFDSLDTGPDLRFPSAFEAPRGGQPVIAAGYDDTIRVIGERGALRVRGPWGPGWGDSGYGWLPYRNITELLAGDCWTILRPDWLAAGDFSRPPGTA